MELPPLSVIETDIEVPKAPSEEDTEEPQEPTLGELRKQFRDFRITQPQQEETFWGTSNAVFISWGGSQPVAPDMKVMLYVNGEVQQATASGGTALTLERGEHQVYAVLRDAQNRRITTTETVTFFIKQHSVNFRRPGIGS